MGKLDQFIREHEKGARRSLGTTTSSAHECESDAPHVVGECVNRIGKVVYNNHLYKNNSNFIIILSVDLFTCAWATCFQGV